MTGWTLWTPVLAALLCYFAFPQNALATAFLYPRFGVFVVPTLLVALEPPERRFR